MRKRRTKRKKSVRRVISTTTAYKRATNLALRSKLDMEGECWIWLGYAATVKGILYPMIRRTETIGKKNYSRYLMASRVAYACWVGPIPPKHRIQHTCGNPLCLRPDHLQLISSAEHTRKIQSWRRDMETLGTGRNTYFAVVAHAYVGEAKYLTNHDLAVTVMLDPSIVRILANSADEAVKIVRENSSSNIKRNTITIYQPKDFTSLKRVEEKVPEEKAAD